MLLIFAMMAGVCSAADSIGVACSLPYARAKVDPSCVGQHIVTIQKYGTDANAKITAELVGLDTSGKLINSIQVQDGDRVQMGSRLSPTDWKFVQNKNLSEVFAPVPLLHVTVEDRGLKAEAFCSNIPYVQVVQPTGGVVSESSGNHTNVLAAVPRTDPGALHLYVDGVDLLAQVPLGNYLACTLSAPCSGTATINGNAVAYSNLAVDVASKVDALASNTIAATLTDLTCGGHIFRVSSARQADFPAKVSAACNVDPLSKAGTSSVFAISITDPTPGKVTPIIPTPVAGQVCSGTEIVNVNINGKVLPATNTFTPGNGNTSGDLYVVPINTTLDQTDLVRDAFNTHDAPLGTFDLGSNRLAASARDKGGNRTFKNVIFATGSIAPVAVDPNATIFQTAAVQSAVNTQLSKMVQARIQTALNGPTSTNLQNAFVVGLSASGAQTMFNKLCTAPVQSSDATINGLTPGQIFSKKVTEAIQAVPPTTVSIPAPCSCDPDVTMKVTSVNVGSNVTCNLTFNDGFFHVSMGLPDVHVVAEAKGSCEDDVAGLCVAGTAVAIQGTADITGIKFDFDVTEANLLSDTTSPTVFYKGATQLGAQNIRNDFGGSGVSFCGISVVCDVLVTIFTFGQIDLTPTIDISQVTDFSGQIGASQPDPVKLKQIKVDENVVAQFNQKSSGDVSAVRITPSGITAGLVGHFATLAVDPTVPATPGVAITDAPVPTLPVPNAGDIFIGISDDAINMMFASLTGAGQLQPGRPGGNGCVNTGVTIGSLLPADCDTLALDNDIATVAARGYCHAIRGDTCSALAYNNPLLTPTDNANLTATEQGECYGAQGLPAGQTCATIAQGNLVTWGACTITPYLNLRANQSLLFCAKGDVPPRMLFPDTGGGPGSVPAVLRIPSLSVGLIVDRDLDGQVTGPFGGVPGCFAQGTSTAVDCNIFEACLALNLNFSMAFQTCPQDAKPGFLPTFQDVQVLARQVGTVCGGATSPTSDTLVLEQSSSDQITIPLGQNGANFAPPICGVGLDLGGFVTCTNPGVLSIRTENTYTDSRDYLAITCSIVGN